MALHRRHVVWAAQECYWQGSGEISVARMLDAWEFAHRRRNRAPKLQDILTLGQIVEPNYNNGKRFREHDVTAGGEPKMRFVEVTDAMMRLVEFTPQELPVIEEIAAMWFKQYEDIHPFADGNGRTGSILYNWLRGTLDHPIHPPDFWQDYKRRYDGYPEPFLDQPNK